LESLGELRLGTGGKKNGGQRPSYIFASGASVRRLLGAVIYRFSPVGLWQHRAFILILFPPSSGNHQGFAKRGSSAAEFGWNELTFIEGYGKNRDNMQCKSENLPACLKLISVIILLVGLGSAILIYQSAGNYTSTVLGYEQGNGTIYPMDPEDYKTYSRDMELYGGTANVLLDELRRWFDGLWHGKSLAFIVACTTILLSSGLFYAAKHMTPLLKTDGNSESNRDGTG